MNWCLDIPSRVAVVAIIRPPIFKIVKTIKYAITVRIKILICLREIIRNHWTVQLLSLVNVTVTLIAAYPFNLFHKL
jgi:hypothetical protein